MGHRQEKSVSHTLSEAENLMKTKTGRKIDPPKADNLLKTNTVSLFYPNINENKCGYAPIWAHANAAEGVKKFKN
jgi:hypothetical protein